MSFQDKRAKKNIYKYAAVIKFYLKRWKYITKETSYVVIKKGVP